MASAGAGQSGDAGSSGQSGGRGAAEDALRGLESRIEHATRSAERLISEAAGAALRRPPPAGWQTPSSEPGEGEAPATGMTEIDLLLEAIRSLRDRLPPDLQRRLGEALRELLLAVRALIDWYLERGERERREPSEVQDIPIT
jgi:hypothetical protein